MFEPLALPGYIAKVLLKFQHPHPKHPEHQPAKHNPPQYGAKVQMMEPHDNSPLLDAKGIKELMAIVCLLLYYGRAIDNTLLTALTHLSSAQSKGTNKAAQKILDYCATHPDATIQYHGSQMALKIHSDASYLSFLFIWFVDFEKNSCVMSVNLCILLIGIQVPQPCGWPLLPGKLPHVATPEYAQWRRPHCSQYSKTYNVISSGS
jgi:hypothetical protein